MEAGREAHGSKVLTDTLAAHISCGTFQRLLQVIELLCIISQFFMHAVKGLFLHRLYLYPKKSQNVGCS